MQDKGLPRVDEKNYPLLSSVKTATFHIKALGNGLEDRIYYTSWALNVTSFAD